MEYDPRPGELIHEAVEEAVKASPRLILEPYYQMKEAARIIASRLITISEELKQSKREAAITLEVLTRIATPEQIHQATSAIVSSRSDYDRQRDIEAMAIAKVQAK